MPAARKHASPIPDGVFEFVTLVAAIGLVVAFAFLFSITYLEWVQTPHSAARPLSRRFAVMLLVTGISALSWLLWGPIQRYLANGRSPWAAVPRPQRILQTVHPLMGVEALWPPIQPLASVTERLVYLVCFLAPMCLLFGLTYQLHDSATGRGWTLEHSSIVATVIAAFIFVNLRAKLYGWQLRYYVRHRCWIPLFPSIFLARRAAGARGRHSPPPTTRRGVTSLLPTLLGRRGAKSYQVILVFKSAALGQAWFSVIRTLFETGYWPFRAPWPIRYTDLATGETHIVAPQDKDPIEFSQALQRFRLGFLDADHETTLVELYREGEFDFVVLNAPKSVFHRDGMAMTMRWHNELDTIGLYTILAGHELSARAADVRNMDPDAPFGYRIRGLELSSPSGTAMAELAGPQANA